MEIETIQIQRKNGKLIGIDNIQNIENLLNDYKKEELKNCNEPFHYEAEIASGFNYFIEWLKYKEKKKKHK